MNLIGRLLGGRSSPPKPVPLQESRPFVYSWILSGKLAIGPIPKSQTHWQRLEEAGFRSRFSCCYPEEEVFVAPPSSWLKAGVPLPDHRRQEVLTPERLNDALNQVEMTINQQPATYLHCFAGQERSPLIAVGLLVRLRRLNVLEALDAVRLCHGNASPLYGDLHVLEELIRDNP